MKLFSTVLLIAFACGCAAKHTTRASIVIPEKCRDHVKVKFTKPCTSISDSLAVCDEGVRAEITYHCVGVGKGSQ